jgi:Pyrrolidone-carboxylate peptidase (N-terminal pyroglutamyl peptidase)
MKRVLLAGFSGNNNSSKVILDKCSCCLKKLYLENDFSTCASQIETAVSDGYNLILILGQKPVIKSVCIEIAGRDSCDCLRTDFDYRVLADRLTESGYRVRISENAGNYLCNHVYYHGLMAASSGSKHTHIIFLHVPYLKNIIDVDLLALTLSNFLLDLDFPA